jgi:uncharacterized protein HemX
MKKIGLISGGILLVLLIAFGAYYFIYLNKRDEKVLDNYEKQINSIETSITNDETVDQDVSEEISANITEDDESLDELDASISSILRSLEEIENAEAELGESVE